MSPNVGIGRRARERDRAGRVVRRRLVVVGDEQQVVGLVADVGDVEQHVGPNSRWTDTCQLWTGLEWKSRGM